MAELMKIFPFYSVPPTPHLLAALRTAHVLTLSLVLGFALSTETLVSAATLDFARDVEPILIKRCFECHGPDQQKAKLRLDSRAAALGGGKSGKAALVPGHSAESVLWQRVTSSDIDEMMPPKGERLTADQLATLKTWIDAGAEWSSWDPRQHWSFKPIAKPIPPSTKNKTWSRNEIDRFLLQKLESEGLTPAEAADRSILARRVSLDLTGLPLSFEDAERFASDTSPNAYEQLVDRLLASPHYGEHMARWWLDLARYADSNGYQIDSTRSIWPYRDWVIEAFNSNLAFDQFTIQQLAGDLLPNPTPEQRIATGFNRNTKINDEGGGDAEEYRSKAVKDRVATVATTWLGLTMNCAECHTHKYDPITHEDYYRFYGLFNNSADGGNYSTEPTLAVPAPSNSITTTLSYLESQLAKTEQQLAMAQQQAPDAMRSWEKKLLAAGAVWEPLLLTNINSTGGSSYLSLPDRSILATNVNPIYDTITFEASTALNGITSILLEVLPDSSLPKNGPGRWSQTGNFILDEISVYLIPRTAESLPLGASTNVTLVSAVADWEQDYYRAEHAIDRNPKTGWAIGPKFGQKHFLVITLKEPLKVSEGTRLGFRFESYHGSSHVIGRWRTSVSRSTDPQVLWPTPDDLIAVVKKAVSKRTEVENAHLSQHYRSVSAAIRELEREKIRLTDKIARVRGGRFSTLVMQERSEKPRETYIQNRGNFLDHGKTVTPGTPAFLPHVKTEDVTNRLTLARWLMDPVNPLPSRVTVNRLWERFFGTAIAKTSEDLGRMGEAPSHPELIDWLAADFVESGWDVKAIQRKFVFSAAYRQSSNITPEKRDKDFYNRWLSRGPRFRLDAEMIRDQALSASGLLNAQIGGPSVYPRQVPNLWKEIGFLRPELGMDEWPVSQGPDLYRRGVYTFWRRVCTYPMLSTFDAPSREICLSRRPRTNTPLQALASLNEPTLLECARALGERVTREGGRKPGDQIDYAFRLTTGRRPTEVERDRLVKFLLQQISSFRKDKAAAGQLLLEASADSSEGDAATRAGWMMVANALLNLDEVLNKN